MIVGGCVTASHRPAPQPTQPTTLPSDAVVAHTAQGRAYARANDRVLAQLEFQRAVDAWTPAHRRALERIGLPDDVELQAITEANDACAEALYYLAEDEVAAVRTLEVPVLGVEPTFASMGAFVDTELAPWHASKTAALAKARRAYAPISELGAPRWQVAATARLGAMYRQFAVEIRSTPVPIEIARDTELANGYRRGLEGTSQEFEDVAVRMFESCLRTARENGIDDENARACELATESAAR